MQCKYMFSKQCLKCISDISLTKNLHVANVRMILNLCNKGAQW